MATFSEYRGGMSRACASYSSVTCSTDAANSERLPMAVFTRGVVMTSSTESVTSLAIYGAVGSSTATAYPVHTTTGGSVSMTVAGGRITALSTEAAGLEWLAFQADTAASPSVVLKS